MLDLSKAFDMLYHQILFRKLSSYGIRGAALAWFVSYLSDRRQKVVIDQTPSPWSEVQWGVPQGSILGPLLFSLYVNDLAQVAATSKVRQYADDTSAYSACATPIELSCSLSKDLDSISCWIKRNKLFLNTAKNQLMLLSRRKRSRDLESVQVELMGSKVDWRHTVKYLGVWIGEKLTWEGHIKYVGKSALVAWLDFGKCELFYLRIH